MRQLQMKANLLPALVPLLSLLVISPHSSQAQLYPVEGANPGAFRILIQRPDSTGVFSGDFTNRTSADNGTDALASVTRSFAGEYVPTEVYNVDTNGTNDLTPSQLCAYLKEQNPDVTSCEPDFRVTIDAPSASPNDPDFDQQYDMTATSVQNIWKAGNFGSTTVKVCVIDTGTDLMHPDIMANLWTNPGETRGSGASKSNGYQNDKDDDGNGIIDDIYGADFVSGSTDGNVQDQNGHGTFVAGVVGAVGNNGVGVTGMTQVANIITCRFMDASGNGWVSDAIRCIEYCIGKGAHVMSNSWGGVEYSDSLQSAINQATTRGVLFVASAGNEGVNTDTTKHYPSSLPDDIVLAVAATDKSNALWKFSNYGVSTVDIGAPGVSVLNLGLGGQYISLTGTSMATPHVSGCAALMLAQYANNGFNISSAKLGTQIKRLMLATSDPLAGGRIKNGRLNCFKAFQRVPSSSGGGSIESFGVGGSETTANANGAPNPQPTSTLPSFTTVGGGSSNLSSSSSSDDATAINTLWYDDGDSVATAEGTTVLPPIQAQHTGGSTVPPPIQAQSTGRRRQLRHLQDDQSQ